MKKIKRLILVFSLFFIAVSASAQLPKAPMEMKGKIVTGGHFSGGFSGNYLHFTLSPQLGYRLTRGLEMGVRLGYNFNYVFDSYYGNYSIHLVGLGAYANYEIVKGIYLHLEDEETCRLTFDGFASNPGTPQWYNSFFIGIGYRDYITETSYAYISLLYNLRWDYGYNGELKSPYSRPIVIRLGYCFGL